jgi:hypothetical protein
MSARFRLCGVNGQVCDCNDLEAQPCIARAIEEYLDTIRWGVLTDRAEGGPGDEMSIGCAHRDFHVTTRSFATLTACEAWSIKCGCGGFIEMPRRKTS